MAHLHLDAFSGAAGDMLLAALIDAGADAHAISCLFDSLRVDGLRLYTERVTRSGLAALRVEVAEEEPTLHEHDSPALDEYHDHHHDDHHGHHGHHHPPHGSAHPDQHHDHPDDDGQLASGHAHPHRNLPDMLHLCDHAACSDRAKSLAKRTFHILAEAESAVHGVPVEEVHFHEIGGVDTVGDILGVAYALELLDVMSVSCGTVTTGSGIVTCSHGVLPVPAPATAEILRWFSIPWSHGDIKKELLTPTGAALMAACVDSFETCPPLKTAAIGYGAGRRDFPQSPNVVRATLGTRCPDTAEPASAGSPNANAADSVWELTAAVDDMTGEESGFLSERCLAAGALDCYAAPVFMKKNRPGVELTVLADEAGKEPLIRLLLAETSTFGLRVQRKDRRVLARTSESVDVRGMAVRFKLGLLDGRVLKAKPEYDDLRALSLRENLPLRDAARLAHDAWSCLHRQPGE